MSDYISPVEQLINSLKEQAAALRARGRDEEAAAIEQSITDHQQAHTASLEAFKFRQKVDRALSNPPQAQVSENLQSVLGLLGRK